MNLSALTAKEVMRICQPETDLEKRLFDIINEIQSDLESAQEDLDGAIHALENDSVSFDDWNSLVRSVRSAIREIESGKVDSAKKILESALCHITNA